MRQDEVVNPWAVCHAQLGKKKTKKFERCVMKVKAKHGIKEDAGILASIAGRGLYDLGKAGARLLRQKVAARRQRPKTEVAVEENSHLDEQADYIAWILNEGGEERIKRQMGAVKQTHSDWDRMQGKLGYKRQQRKLRTAASIERGVAKRRPDLAAKHTDDGAPRPEGGAYTGPAAELRQARASRRFTSGMKAHGSEATAASAAKKAVKRKNIRRDAEWRHKRKALKTQGQERASRQRRFGSMGDHTEYEGPSLAETKDWIQGAINPDHKGYCTPMTKETCTPARKAFAKRAKRGDI